MTKFAIKNVIIREFFGELLGTFIFVTYGLSGLAQFVLGGGKYGGALGVSWAFGVGVCIAIYLTIGVSGGHVNPALTVGLASIGKLPWRKVPHYLLGQYLGAFVAAAVVYLLYFDAVNNFDGGVRAVEGPNATAGIWATYPNSEHGISTINCFVDQVIGSYFLILGITGIGDSKNSRLPFYLRPLLVGFLVFLHGSTFVLNCGSAVNPARDLAPRLFTAVAGWGWGVFTAGNYFFWIPLTAPHIGGVLGAWTYVVFIGHHIPSDVTPDVVQLVGKYNGGYHPDTQAGDVNQNYSVETATTKKCIHDVVLT